jgi:DNA-binding transcriptional regulator YdaS (Cro superfamily)
VVGLGQAWPFAPQWLTIQTAFAERLCEMIENSPKQGLLREELHNVTFTFITRNITHT